jgi:superfamily I DNA and/or RNA helicase
MYENISEDSFSDSKQNLGEADLVIQTLRELFSEIHSLKGSDIGVISPYSAQVSLIKKQIQHTESTEDKFTEQTF